MAKAPQLPDPPKDYSRDYLVRLLRSLAIYFNQIDNPGPLQATTINFSSLSNGTAVAGLVTTSTLNGALLVGATSVTLADASGFAASGDAYILDGATSDKIKYTGKSTNTLTGVTGVANVHLSGKLVVASARTGDVFADQLNEYTLKMIP